MQSTRVARAGCKHAGPPNATVAACASAALTSWAVQRHIDEAHGAINYSQFATDPGQADETIQVIRDGSMPPAYFTRFGINPGAKLTDAERDALIAGLEKTPGMAAGR